MTVPVTPQLSSEDAGFLPIHCMHQLLRSRAFTKHAVHVKVSTLPVETRTRYLGSLETLLLSVSQTSTKIMSNSRGTL